MDHRLSIICLILTIICYDFLNQSNGYTDWTRLQSVQYITKTNHIGKIIFKVIYFERPGSVLIYSKQI